MSNFTDAKIYRIWSPSRPDLGCYIGSTSKTLRRRLDGHRALYRAYLSTNKGYCSSFDILESGDFAIELVQAYPCENREQLNLREGYWILNTPGCVNRNIAGRSSAESRAVWYAANRDQVRESRKAYYIRTQEALGKATCPVCNCQFVRMYRENHNLTRKHLRNLANQSTSDSDLELEMAQLAI